jgi:hypothetical protein
MPNFIPFTSKAVAKLMAALPKLDSPQPMGRILNLLKKASVTDEEVAFSGLEELNKSLANKPVKPADVIEHIKAKAPKVFTEAGKEYDTYSISSKRGLQNEGYKTDKFYLDQETKDKIAPYRFDSHFTSSETGEPAWMHTRSSDKYTKSGERVRHVEEIQSDPHQKAQTKKQGYRKADPAADEKRLAFQRQIDEVDREDEMLAKLSENPVAFDNRPLGTKPVRRRRQDSWDEHNPERKFITLDAEDYDTSLEHVGELLGSYRSGYKPTARIHEQTRVLSKYGILDDKTKTILDKLLNGDPNNFALDTTQFSKDELKALGRLSHRAQARREVGPVTLLPQSGPKRDTLVELLNRGKGLKKQLEQEFNTPERLAEVLGGYDPKGRAVSVVNDFYDPMSSLKRRKTEVADNTARSFNNRSSWSGNNNPFKLPTNAYEEVPEVLGRNMTDRYDDYVKNPRIKGIPGAFRELNYERRSDLQNKIRELNPASKIPDLPFKKNWPRIGLKKALIDAVEGGYDWLSLTRGGDAARYDKAPTTTANISFDADKGTMSFSPYDETATPITQAFAPEDMDMQFGKQFGDAVRKAMAGGQRQFNISADEARPQNLFQFGETFGSHYDQSLPSELTAIIKELTGQAPEIERMSGFAKPQTSNNLDNFVSEVLDQPGTPLREEINRIVTADADLANEGEYYGRNILSDLAWYAQHNELPPADDWYNQRISAQGGDMVKMIEQVKQLLAGRQQAAPSLVPATLPSTPHFKITDIIREAVKKGVPLYSLLPLIAEYQASQKKPKQTNENGQTALQKVVMG